MDYLGVFKISWADCGALVTSQPAATLGTLLKEQSAGGVDDMADLAACDIHDVVCQRPPQPGFCGQELISI